MFDLYPRSDDGAEIALIFSNGENLTCITIRCYLGMAVAWFAEIKWFKFFFLQLCYSMNSYGKHFIVYIIYMNLNINYAL